MIAMIDRAIMSLENVTVASGNMGSVNRRNPYVPILRRTLARMTLPAVGASTCASGNQVCKGNMGTLTAKAAKKAQKRSVCRDALYVPRLRARISNVWPPLKYSTRMATSSSMLPAKV